MVIDADSRPTMVQRVFDDRADSAVVTIWCQSTGATLSEVEGSGLGAPAFALRATAGKRASAIATHCWATSLGAIAVHSRDFADRCNASRTRCTSRPSAKSGPERSIRDAANRNSASAAMKVCS